MQALRKRAGAQGSSAEADHRAILAAAMPDVGEDADFERQDDGRRCGPCRCRWAWIEVVREGDAQRLAGCRWHVVARALREGRELPISG